MASYDSQLSTVESRENDRQKIALQVEEFLRQGGNIERLDSHFVSPDGVPRKAMSNEIGLF